MKSHCDRRKHIRSRRIRPERRRGPRPFREKLAYAFERFITDVEELARATGVIVSGLAGRRLASVAAPAGRIAIQLAVLVGVPIAILTFASTAIGPISVSERAVIAGIVTLGAKSMFGQRRSGAAK